MATSSAATVMDTYATMGGVRYQLNITVRIGDDAPANLSSEKVQGMVAHTIATWQRAMDAILTDTWHIAEFGGKVWPSAEEKQGVTVRNNHEPYVTVWNKGGAAVNITVHSWDNGVYALETAKDMLAGLEKFKEYATAFGFESFEFAPLHKASTPTPKPSAAPKRDIDDVDSFLNDPATHGVTPPQSTGQAVNLPFRFFKRLAPNIIQLQEFVQGGGGKDKYQKSAIEATLPFHKTNVQYDDGAFVYYPITGAIQIKEGNYGKQAIIPTAKGRVYVDMEYNGQEKPEWAVFSGDLHNEYERLLNNENAQLFAPKSVLVLKASAITKDKKGADVQYKNYYRIYQALD